MAKPKNRTYILNIYRKNDPVAQLSGRHPESIVVLPPETTATQGGHSLNSIIELLKENKNRRTNPARHFKFTCDSKINTNGSILQKTINLKIPFNRICF